MRKGMFAALLLLIVLVFCACGGKVSDAKNYTADSELYNQEEITAAIDVIKKEFRAEWTGAP